MTAYFRANILIRLALICFYLEWGASGKISKELYSDLVFYFKYASSAYAFICPKPNGKSLVGTFNNILTCTGGYIARDDFRKEIVVAFGGSLSAVDIITDIGILLVPFHSHGVSAPPGTLIHSGFLTAWNSVAKTVVSDVAYQLKLYEDYSIVVTGHSLGGALSSLAAVSLKGNLPGANITMYTFGQPRTGNAVYAFWVNKLLGDRAFRVVHTSDGVPTMIPTRNNSFLDQSGFSSFSPERTYRHHGIEYWQKDEPPSENTVSRCSPDGEDPNCSRSIPSHGINIPHFSYFGILAIKPFCL